MLFIVLPASAALKIGADLIFLVSHIAQLMGRVKTSRSDLST